MPHRASRKFAPTNQEAILSAIEMTKNNTNMTLNLAFDYGGRAEIVDAAKKIISEKIPLENIDEKLFGSYLYTNSLPEVDLVIRTGETCASRIFCYGNQPTVSSILPMFYGLISMKKKLRKPCYLSAREKAFRWRIDA